MQLILCNWYGGSGNYKTAFFQESETKNEELERIKVENKMLISKISDLMASRDQARLYLFNSPLPNLNHLIMQIM